MRRNRQKPHVREEEYGEVKEKEDDIIIENTEEEVYGEDDEQQLELQDEAEKKQLRFRQNQMIESLLIIC